ncbi:hypothetical protein [Aeromonas caviae]|uniref:Uncharacterized protein n=1 Tax=Aeromonas caviae TaxID=648 RepID=A0AAI9KWE7_AERCA|nr:hypothetical protein [Aeromonas caviae]BCM75161.1 hypothetical protein KAM329_017110 [Aeromonas caviae]BCR28842.1 hypothetical protein KAM376_18480 [Aeromonas caviae]GJA11420.1 hypothetical protein KAM334_27310 [Aeromonas caviae]GJA48777.1 hypothetical protein KAM347_05680 [Aeromonas caviae]GJA56859.1 hypothetical protein KAM348_42820 [Aeromonas caviae]
MKLTLDELLQEPDWLEFLSPYRVLDLIPGFDGEYEHYVQRAFLNIIGIPELDWLEIPEPGDGLGSWTPEQALAVLTYGPRSHLNVELIVEIERVTGESLPRIEGKSRFEAAFYLVYLLPLLNEFKQRDTWTMVQPQYVCDPYRVDFCVGLSVFRPDSSSFRDMGGWEQYLIEFDEAYHQEPANRLRDQQRDRHIEQVTGLKPIRVRHEEQEVWARICRIEQEIISVEEYLRRLLKLMVWRRGEKYIDIIRDSTQYAYMWDEAGYLHYPRQPLRDLKRIAKRLGLRVKAKHTGKQAFYRFYL